MPRNQPPTELSLEVTKSKQMPKKRLSIAIKIDQLGVEASVRIVVGGENFRLVAMVVNQKDFDKAMFRIRSQIYPGAWRILLTGQKPVEDLSSRREMLVTQQESKDRPSSQDDGKIQIGEINPQRKNSDRSPIDLDYSLKVFTSVSDLESSDVQRLFVDSPSSDMNVDFRVMAGKDVGDFRFDIHYNVVNQIGDSLQSQANVIGELDSLELDDDFRLLSLARELDSGERHRAGHRLDRFSLQWQKNDWRISAGRQACWGGGFIFHPIDPFNPFSPTAVDKDYKVGNDSILVQRIFPLDMTCSSCMYSEEIRRIKSVSRWRARLSNGMGFLERTILS